MNWKGIVVGLVATAFVISVAPSASAFRTVSASAWASCNGGYASVGYSAYSDSDEVGYLLQASGQYEVDATSFNTIDQSSSTGLGGTLVRPASVSDSFPGSAPAGASLTSSASASYSGLNSKTKSMKASASCALSVAGLDNGLVVSFECSTEGDSGDDCPDFF